MAANLLLKFVVAGAVLMLGLSAPTFAAPRNQECVDCPISNKYDSEEVVEKIKRIKKTLANEEPIDVRAGRADYETGRIRHTGRGSKAVPATPNAPTARRGGNTTARRSSRRSATSTVRASSTPGPWCRSARRIKETNHLVDPRERDPQRRRDPAQSHHCRKRNPLRPPRAGRDPVDFVTHDYRVVERPDFDHRSGVAGPGAGCSRGYGRYHGSCRPLLRVRD